MKVKKNKKANLNNNPLEPVTIAQVKESKFGWIGVILIFGLFIAIVYFLPEIEQLYQVYIKGNTSIIENNSSISNNVNINTNENTTNDNENKEIDISYKFTDNNEIDIDNLTFNNINLDNNKLSINIQNNSKSLIKIDDLDLFMEIYDSNDNLLNRIWLYGNIESESNLILIYTIKSNANYFKIKVIPEEDYTYEDFIIDDNNKTILTCNANNEQLIYTFINDKLIEINHTKKYAKTNSDYDSVYSSLSSLVINNNGKAGIKTIFNSNSIELNFSLTIDYNIFNSTIDNKYYFNKDISPRIVNFKVESMFFDCK